MNIQYWLRRIVPALTLALCCQAYTAVAQQSVTDPVSGLPMLADEIYVKLRAGAAGTDVARSVAELAGRAGLQPLQASRVSHTDAIPSDKTYAARIQSVPADRRQSVAAAIANLGRWVRLRLAPGTDPQVAARRMSALKEVEFAEPVYGQFTFSPPNDSLLNEQTHLPKIHLPEAWELWQGDSNTVIGIVDSGIDMFHEDLAPNIKENPGETGKDAQGRDKRTNGVDDDGNGVIDDWRGANLTATMDSTTPGNTKGDGHGTVVSGFAAAATNNRIGVAGAGYKCRFFPVKTAPKNGSSLYRAYDGLVYCAERGFKVINCSWGGNVYLSGAQDIITNVIDAYDVAIVAAGGNGRLYDRFYPSGYKGVLGVGALNEDGTLNTTWGEHIGVSAPCRYSTLEDNQYTPSGPATSFTTPVVSGIMALVRSRFPQLSSLQAITHVRLTSDNVDSLNPGKEKLMGYGRVNALRAIQTLPMTHPGVLLDSVWTTDMNNVPRDNFSVGQSGKLWLRLRNVLGDAANLRLSAATYNADSAVVKFGPGFVTVPSVKSNATAQTTDGITFQVTGSTNKPVWYRIDLTGDGGYRDYYYASRLLYKPFVNVGTDRIVVSLSNQGNIGFADYPANVAGDGFRYLGSSFLYEGGFIIARDILHVISNVRGTAADTQDRDLTATEFPSAANNNTVTLTDSAATGSGRAIGLILHAGIVSYAAVPDAVGILVRTRNTSGKPIDSLRLAMFFDWDIDSTGDNQSVSYGADPTGPVPVFGRVSGDRGYYVSAGVARPVPFPLFYAIQNDGTDINIYNSFDQTEKWKTVSNGVGVTTAGPGDISMVIGKRIAGMADGAEDTTLFVIGCGTVLSNAVKAMKDFAIRATSGVNDPADGAAAQGRLKILGGGTGSGQLTIVAVARQNNATLGVYDLMGRRVADLTARLAHNGMPSIIGFNPSALPSGWYYVRLNDGQHTEVQKFVAER